MGLNESAYVSTAETTGKSAEVWENPDAAWNCDSAAERAGMQDHKAEDGAARHHTEWELLQVMPRSISFS